MFRLLNSIIKVNPVPNPRLRIVSTPTAHIMAEPTGVPTHLRGSPNDGCMRLVLRSAGAMSPSSIVVREPARLPVGSDINMDLGLSVAALRCILALESVPVDAA